MCQLIHSNIEGHQKLNLLTNLLICRYRHAKDRAQRMVVIPRYEPVFVEPNMKEYEVQVLQMSVNMDDIDNNTAKMDFRRNQRFDPGFNLDSVSYITHDTSISKIINN